MGSTGTPDRPTRPTPECAVLALHETYYRSLVRLAALLTGDAEVAEAAVCDALAVRWLRLAPAAAQDDETLRHLQQQVLIRCRRSRWQHRQPRRDQRTPPRYQGTGCGPSAARQQDRPAAGGHDFAHLPVVRALQELPVAQREAVVLTHYLDLTEQQAAAIVGIPVPLLRQRLNAGLRTLAELLPAPRARHRAPDTAPTSALAGQRPAARRRQVARSRLRGRGGR